MMGDTRIVQLCCDVQFRRHMPNLCRPQSAFTKASILQCHINTDHLPDDAFSMETISRLAAVTSQSSQPPAEFIAIFSDSGVIFARNTVAERLFKLVVSEGSKACNTKRLNTRFEQQLLRE
jgi:hypothetical protein